MSGLTTQHKRTLMAYFSLIIVAFIWGNAYIVTKCLLKSLSPLFLLAIRFTVSSILLFLLFNKNILRYTDQELKSGFFIGIILFSTFITQILGLQYTTAVKQVFILATKGIFVPFMVWVIYKKYPGWHVFIGGFLCLMGISFISLKQNLLIGFGDTLSLVSAFFYAAYIVAIERYVKDDMNPVNLAFFQLGTVAIIFLLLAFFFEPLPSVLNKEVYLPISYLVILGTVLSYILQNIALKHIPSTHTIIILSLEPVFCAISATIFLHEVFTTKMLFGSILIFCQYMLARPSLPL